MSSNRDASGPTPNPTPRLAAAGLKALAVSVPDRILGNDHWQLHQPALVAQAEQKLWMWKRPERWAESARSFDEEMEPYLSDPFRGARQRRVLPEGGTALELEEDAARQALDAAGLDPTEVDLLICSSFLPDSHGVGGATFLARALGLRGAAWNLESACSSTLLALETACSLIRSGVHRNILVVTSCTYSRATREDDPISWGVGDAATAMVVGPVLDGAGLLGTYSVHSAETCGAVAYHLEEGESGSPRLRMRTGRQAARLLRETSERYLLECVGGVLGKCGLGLSEIDAFVFHTPLAWYGRFCARALGVDPARTLSTYPLYANAGPSLVGLNLIHAAHWRPLEPHHLVLLYTVGSVSSCAAAVVRWGDVALGELPEEATPELLASLDDPFRTGRGLIAVA